MPELPEVHTTATILNELISGKKITDVWTDYNSPHYKGKENIKDPAYFALFKKAITGKKIIRVWRRAKNVLIDIEGSQTILIHMKMTGHLLYGRYALTKDVATKKNAWTAQEEGPLQDPFNRFVHFVISLSNGSHVAFSDMRKFATVHLIKDADALLVKTNSLGVEPLDETFNSNIFKKQLSKRPLYKMKTALMDQSLVVGIGNIYSDEILWSSHIHPERLVKNISDSEYKLLTKNTKNILGKGINFGGDSMSDYRNPHGVPGDFQNHHNAYRRTKQTCNTKGCKGIIERKVIGGRSAHFCSVCQK